MAKSSAVVRYIIICRSNHTAMRNVHTASGNQASVHYKNQYDETAWRESLDGFLS